MRLQPKKIMCAIDLSDFTNELLAYSVALCKEFHAKLFLVHIVVDMNSFLAHTDNVIDEDMFRNACSAHVRSHIEKFVNKMTIAPKIVISMGDPADEIRRLALKEEIDMVITASHGKSGIKRLLLGSVTEKLLKTIHCPLLVMCAQELHFIPLENYQTKLKKILVGCDFSPDSKLAFDYGLSLAQEFQADLYLAHVIKPTEHIEVKSSDYIKVFPGDYVKWSNSDYFEMQQKVTEENREKINSLHNRLKKQLLYMLPEECKNWCSPQTTLLNGEPYRELIDYAKDQGIDMIVLGIRGHTLLEKLMVGSTADRVIRDAPCPVLAVRQMNES